MGVRWALLGANETNRLESGELWGSGGCVSVGCMQGVLGFRGLGSMQSICNPCGRFWVYFFTLGMSNVDARMEMIQKIKNWRICL